MTWGYFSVWLAMMLWNTEVGRRVNNIWLLFMAKYTQNPSRLVRLAPTIGKKKFPESFLMPFLVSFQHKAYKWGIRETSADQLRKKKLLSSATKHPGSRTFSFLPLFEPCHHWCRRRKHRKATNVFNIWRRNAFDK